MSEKNNLLLSYLANRLPIFKSRLKNLSNKKYSVTVKSNEEEYSILRVTDKFDLKDGDRVFVREISSKTASYSKENTKSKSKNKNSSNKKNSFHSSKNKPKNTEVSNHKLRMLDGEIRLYPPVLFTSCEIESNTLKIKKRLVKRLEQILNVSLKKGTEEENKYNWGFTNWDMSRQVNPGGKKNIIDIRKNLDCKIDSEKKTYIDTSVDSPLNDVQKQAFDQLPLKILGPPGTGKTRTLIDLIKYYNGKKRNIENDLNNNRISTIIFAAPSNKAVDNVYKHFGGVRLGGGYDKLTIKQFKDNFNNKTKKTQNKNYKHEKMNNKKNNDYCDPYSTISNTPLIFSTLTSLSKLNYLVDLVIIDEVCQASEEELLLGLFSGKNVILSGDPWQLGSVEGEIDKKSDLENCSKTEQESDANNLSLSNTFSNDISSLFTMLQPTIALFHIIPFPLLTLNTNYRSHFSLFSCSNLHFYDSFLISQIKKVNIWFGNGNLLFVDTSDLNYTDKKGNANLKGNSNEMEGNTIKLMAEYLDRQAKNIILQIDSKNIEKTDIKTSDKKVEKPIKIRKLIVGIITPYNSQVTFLKDIFSSVSFDNLQITISTVDSFQGSEQDIILLSLTRSNEEMEIGFLKDVKRMNVAITRAKWGIGVVGNREMFHFPDVKKISQLDNFSDLNIETQNIVYNKIEKLKNELKAKLNHKLFYRTLFECLDMGIVLTVNQFEDLISEEL